MKATLYCGREHSKDGNVFLNRILWSDETKLKLFGQMLHQRREF